MEQLRWFYADGDSYAQVSWNELQELAEERVITPDTLVGWEGLDGSLIPFRHSDAKYFYVHKGTTSYAYTDAELQNASAEGQVTSSTRIWGKGLPSKGIQYEALLFADLEFVPKLAEFIEQRNDCSVTILSGRNNTGKSLILKLLRKEYGPAANYLSCNRFYHFDHLNPASGQGELTGRRYEQFLTQLYQRQQNAESNDLPLQQVIAEMTNDQRDMLFQICSDLLDEEFVLRQAREDNQMLPWYVEVGGQNLAVASTGSRLLLMIVAACLDNRYNTFLIDEPEIGLSPRLQARLARYLFSPELQAEYFPHMKRLFVATHSHLYLDRGNMSNNFIVTKEVNRVSIDQVNSISKFHDLQFNMLGNDLEALFLPAAVILVEGETDRDYINRLLQIHLPDKRISVVRSGGEGEMKKYLHIIQESLGDLMKSPYRERIFVLVDKNRTVKKRDFTKHGIPEENLVFLEKNGIEYYYPSEILSTIFGCGTDPCALLQIGDGTVEANGITKTKKSLCKAVIDQLTPASRIPDEIWSKLLNPIQERLN